MRWSNSVNWIVPPHRLIRKVVGKIEQEKCKCTSVIPEWESVPFWPMLVKEGSFKLYLRSVVKFKNVEAVCRGKGNNGIFGKIRLV